MTPNNKKIAVTGGIGSGKSLACEILREAGFPVFSCDKINAELWTDGDYLYGLSQLFPACISDGKVDKCRLSALVFRDEEARKVLNGYAHEKIMQKLYAAMEGYPLSFAEVPLLFECEKEGDFDGVIAILRGMEERISAVVLRDGLSREEVKARINSQYDYSKISEKPCIMIENDGDKARLRERILCAVSQLKESF